MPSASTQAKTVTTMAQGRFSFPLAERAPAARSQGAAGNGTPACSKKTNTNKTTPPWLTRNWVISDIMLDGKPDLKPGFPRPGFEFNFTSVTVADDAIADNQAKAGA